jgi:hypothetical protein
MMARSSYRLTAVAVAAFLLLAATCSLNCSAGAFAAAPQPQAGHGNCSMPTAPEAPQAPFQDDCGHHEAVAAALKTVAPLPANALVGTGTLPPVAQLPAMASQTSPTPAPALLQARVLPFDSHLPLRI